MIRIYPLLPLFLCLFAGGLSLTLAIRYGMRAPDLSKTHRKILTGICAAALALLTVMLLSPGITVREPDRRSSNIVFLLDASASMATEDMPEKESRFEAGKKILEKLRCDELGKCGKYTYLFRHTAFPADDTETVDTALPSGETNLKNAFSVPERDLGTANIGAIVVISDGLDQSGFSGTRAGFPVYAVKTGSALSGVPDLGIDFFPVPGSVRTGETLEIDLPVTLNGYPVPKEAVLTIETDGHPSGVEKRTVFSGKRVTIPFRTVFDTQGLHTVKFSLNKLENEISHLNNTREIAVEVRDNNMETLLYYPVLNSGFRPLVRFLAGKSFTAVYRLGDGRCSIVSNGRSSSAFDRGFPRDAKKLERTDVVLLGSGDPANYTRQEIDTLEKYVSNGGSLVIPGGPGAFTNGNQKFSAMLPVRGDGTFLNGEFEPFPEKPDGPFNGFPFRKAILRGINTAERLRSQAEVLLSVRGNARTYPLAAAMPYGRGRVIAIMTNGLHLLGTGTERKTLFRSFWEHLMVYAGEGREDRMRIAVNTETPASGEKLEVTAVLPDTDSSAEAELLFPDSTRRIRGPVRMRKDNAVHRARFDDLPDGRWILKVTATGKAHDPMTRFRMISPGEGSAENTNLKVTDENFLKFCTRGHVFEPDEVPRLLSELNTGIRKNDQVREWYPVFETPYFAAAVFLLLMVLYYFRRRFNLF